MTFDLEAGQNMSVGQTKERVRVTEATEIAKTRMDPRVERIAYIHHHRMAGHVIVRKQKPGLRASSIPYDGPAECESPTPPRRPSGHN